MLRMADGRSVRQFLENRRRFITNLRNPPEDWSDDARSAPGIQGIPEWRDAMIENYLETDDGLHIHNPVHIMNTDLRTNVVGPSIQQTSRNRAAPLVVT